MANTITPRDAYALLNSIASQATGRTDLVATDTSSFVSVGETLLRTSTENTLSAISTVLSRTIFSVRPYKGKLDSLRVSQERWGAMIRKIVYLYSEAEQSQDWNTAQNTTQLNNGNTVDMYKIKKPLALQLNFYGSQVLQKHITRFRDQLAQAFQSETEFMAFIDGVMVEFYNEIELLNESKSRAVLLNFMAGLQAMGLTVVDLAEAYNVKFGTSYTRAQLLSTYLQSFMQFVASTVKIWSERLTDMSASNHANLTGYPVIMRHTPKARQKMVMYNPIFIETQAQVYSQIFNPEYLEIGNFEGVNYWQNPKDPTAINIKPNILNVATGTSVDASAAVEIDYALGLLYDEDALGVIPQFDYSSTTPFNSAGGYYNLFMHWRFNSYNDFTENAVLFTIGEGGAVTSV